MRLLLDEMVSWRIAAELWDSGHDVVAVKRDRPQRTRARGDDQYGIIYTHDDTLPRNKAAFPLWVATLDELLKARPAVDYALLNREHHLRTAA